MSLNTDNVDDNDSNIGIKDVNRNTQEFDDNEKLAVATEERCE